MLNLKLALFLLCLCLEIIFKLLLQAIEVDFLTDKFLLFFHFNMLFFSYQA